MAGVGNSSVIGLYVSLKTFDRLEAECCAPSPHFHITQDAGEAENMVIKIVMTAKHLNLNSTYLEKNVKWSDAVVQKQLVFLFCLSLSAVFTDFVANFLCS